MKCYCFDIKFSSKLNDGQEDILISFFQKAINEGVQTAEKMCENAKKVPGVRNRIEMLETLKNYLEIQKRYFDLEKTGEKSYLFVMPSMKTEILKLRNMRLNFPDVRVAPIKKTLEEHVFKEMGKRGLVFIKEEDRKPRLGD